jgi:hypothetical protein
MDIKTPEQNGAGGKSLAQTAAQNLTLQQNVVRSHEGVEPLPGYVLAVFEKRAKGGAIFARLVNPGERPPTIFRIPFLDWAQRYLSIAVNDSVLKYEFDDSVVLDDGSDVFKLKFHLTYRVADPQKVAEIWEHDPLRQLRDEIARAIKRNCAKRKAEMLRNRFRSLEKIVVDDESARLRPYAATLGLKVISIDLDKLMLDGRIDVIEARNKAEVEKDRFAIEQGVNRVKQETSRAVAHQTNLEDVHHKYDVQQVELERQLNLESKLDQVHQRNQMRKLREIEAEAVGKAVINVAENTNTPGDLVEAFGAVNHIRGTIQAENGASSPPKGLLPESERIQIGNGTNRLNDLLNEGIQEVDRWKCTSAQKQALCSTLLHIVAEALLDDHADETILKQYANKLTDLGRGFEPQLNRTQRDFLGQFMDFNALRNKLR